MMFLLVLHKYSRSSLDTCVGGLEYALDDMETIKECRLCANEQLDCFWIKIVLSVQVKCKSVTQLGTLEETSARQSSSG